MLREQLFAVWVDCQLSKEGDKLETRKMSWADIQLACIAGKDYYRSIVFLNSIYFEEARYV